RFAFVDVAQHENGGLQQGRGVSDVFAGNVGGGAVDGLEDGGVGADVGSGNESQAADEGRAQVAHDVAIEVFEQQHVVLVGVHDELHAGVVDDVLAVGDLRKVSGDFPRALEEQAVGHLHDVGLVNGVDLLPIVFARVLKGEFCDAGGTLAGDDFEGLDNSGNDFVFEADVLPFGVFADDDEIDAGVAGFQAAQVLDGAEVGIELKFFAQRHVDGGEASGNGRGDGALERKFVALDRVVKILRNVFLVLLEGLGSCGIALPLEADAGGFEDADDGVGNFGADSVSGNQRNGVR